jgi:hypothetical protein
MNQIVESKIFTDEQKVSIIKAVVEKSITLSFVPSFTKMKDYYFIMNENIYQYVMTFTDGFKYLYLNTSNEKFVNAFVENNYPIEMGYNMSLKSKEYIFVCNNTTFYPFLYSDNEKIIYSKEGAAAEHLLNIAKNFNFSSNVLEFMKHLIASEITLDTKSEIVIIGKSNDGYDITFKGAQTNHYSIKKEKEKDEFMKMVDDELPMSADAKVKTERSLIDENKKRVILTIKNALKTYNNTALFLPNFINNEEVFEFIKYICKTKNYTYKIDCNNILTITLF